VEATGLEKATKEMKVIGVLQHGIHWSEIRNGIRGFGVGFGVGFEK